jgi:hypothetical protein
MSSAEVAAGVDAVVNAVKAGDEALAGMGPIHPRVSRRRQG